MLYPVHLKRLIIYLFFSLIACFDLWSQSSNPLAPKTNIPTSPESALLDRFGDIPVGYYTGTANISVPLYTIKEGNFDLPLVLNYHSSGIKVEDQATWVGLGWDFSPGGAIIQEVRGKQDDYDNKLSYDPNSNDNYYTKFMGRVNSAPPLYGNKSLDQIGFGQYQFCQPFSTDCNSVFLLKKPEDEDDDMQEIHLGTVIGSLLENNGQPDIYHYNFAGYSGKFFINPETRQIVQLDKKDQIYFEKGISGWITATTLDGTKFTFDVIETAYELGSYPYSDKAGLTFKLSRIQFLSGKFITFEYVNAHFIDYAYSEVATMNDRSGPPSANGPTLNLRQSDIKILSKITTSDAVINFNLAEREDIIPNINNQNNVKRLASIDIFSIATGKKIKSFVFNHSYFPYNLDGLRASSGQLDPIITQYEATFGKRLKLNSIQQIGYDDNQVQTSTIPPYQFEYDMSTTMPLKLSFAKDLWGYYNGASANRNLLPDLGYFDYPYSYLANTNNQPFVYTYQDQANRFTDNTKAGAYLLKTITYPTGGFSQFIYEPNSFTNQFIPDKTSNVAKSYDAIDNSLGGTTSVLFKLSKATTIHFDSHINNGTGNYNGVTPLTYDQMSGCYIRLSKVKMINGSPEVTLVKQWDLSTVLRADFESNGGKIWNEDLRIDFDPDPNPTFNYLLETVFPDNLNNPLFASTAGVTSHITFFDDTGVDISQSKQCGMRIQAIKNYTSAESLANTRVFRYSGGKLSNHFAPIEVLSNCWMFRCQPPPPNTNLGCNTLSEEGPYDRLIISSDGMLRDATMVGYDVVEETQVGLDGITENGIKRFNYFNFENSADHRFQVIVNGLNGLVSTEQVFNKTNEKLTEKSYHYTNLSAGGPCFYSITLNTHFFGGSYTDPYERADLGTRHKYSYNASPLYTEWYKVDSISSKYFSGGLVLQDYLKYSYNSEGSVSSTTTENSKGERIITKYYYPIDNVINPWIDEQMTLVHNTGTPVLDEIYKGSILSSNLLSSNRTEYGQVGAPHLSPKFIYTKKGNRAEELRVTIEKYDDKGNVLQYSERNNIPISIVWNSDKTLPIAKVENATYESLLALPNGLNSDFRTSLPNAKVTTYTYKPLIGVNTITDLNGRTTYYEYDGYGRLIYIRDKDNNILKKICYNYAGQSETCPLTVGNAQKSGTFTKSCSPGYIGSTVTYTVAANTYFAATQQDADARAQSDVNANGQTYANTNGTCVASGPCGFTGINYFSIPTYGFYNGGSSVSGYLVFYSSNTLYPYTWNQVGFVSGSCKPSGTRTFSYTTGGRTFNFSIDSNGLLSVQIAPGSSYLNPYTTVSVSVSYNL